MDNSPGARRKAGFRGRGLGDDIPAFGLQGEADDGPDETGDSACSIVPGGGLQAVTGEEDGVASRPQARSRVLLTSALIADERQEFVEVAGAVTVVQLRHDDRLHAQANSGSR